MIDSKLIRIGKLEDAPAMSAFLVDDGRVALVIGQERVALFPSALRKAWEFFQPEPNGRWKGVIFPNIEIAIDVHSMVSPSRTEFLPGYVSDRGGELIVLSNGEADRSYAQPWLSLSDEELEPSHIMPPLAFSKWEVFVRDEDERIVLLTIDGGSVVGGLLHRAS